MLSVLHFEGLIHSKLSHHHRGSCYTAVSAAHKDPDPAHGSHCSQRRAPLRILRVLLSTVTPPTWAAYEL